MTDSPAVHAVRAELTANVFRVLVEAGDQVAKGDHLMILESMKMEIPVIATRPGIVTSIEAEVHSVVDEGDVLVHITQAD